MSVFAFTFIYLFDLCKLLTIPVKCKRFSKIELFNSPVNCLLYNTLQSLLQLCYAHADI